MGKSKDKKAPREAKVYKKLALGLGVKKKQLKKKKDRVLDGAVESEVAAGHGIAKGSKKTLLMKEKKKTKHVKVTKRRTKDDNLVFAVEAEATPKLKKKSKRQLKESNSPVEAESPLESNDADTLRLKKKNKKVKEGKSSVEPDTLKLKKKKKKVKEGKSSVEPNDADDILHDENPDEESLSADVNQLADESEVMGIGEPEKAKKRKKNKKKKVKQSGEVNTTDMQVSIREDNLERHVEVDTADVVEVDTADVVEVDTADVVEVDTADVDEIASVGEDCSRGMKKWILEYRQKRPGLKVLQQKIDEFITAHEEQQEQEKKEREAAAAEDGWTVVVHHKGRKKTTDAETGTAVGSVSLVAMQEKMAQKKPMEVGPNFYRHQKREAHMTELAMLQSKFEQDKKRIQQLRAQRKFKPY
ncbi:hypothetical protein ACQ4PT_024687 [Festuca glaucescens]